MKKVMVTGGAGFIGSNIVDLLIKRGHDVSIVDDLSRGKKENLNPEAKFYQVDIKDAKKLDAAIAKVKPEIICHQAAQVNVRISLENPISDANNNILGPINVIQSAIKHKVKKITFSSSGGAVYGDPESIPCNEQSRVWPLSPYGISKRSFELYLQAFARLKGFDYTILRYSNVYGVRQDPKGEAGVVSIFTDLALNNKIPTINGDGKQTRDFVFVKDVARANYAAITKKTKSKIFNIGTGKKTSINQLFSIIANTVGAKITPRHVPGIPGEVRHTYLNISLAKKELGWQPKYDLKAGLKETIDWQKSL